MGEINDDKQLIIKLLEKDIMAYKNFIPVIKQMDEESFENFFNGKKNYNYNVGRKQRFSMLIEKVENYKFILDWGYNDDYYPYLEELWRNYICLEDLKSTNEEELKTFLESNNIHYSNWPDNVKSEFKQCIQHTNNTIIYKCKKMYQSLKAVPKYIIEKFKEFIDYLDKMGLTKLGNLAEKLHLSIIGTVLLGGGTIGVSSYRWIKRNVIKSGYGKLFCKETFSFLIKNFKQLAQTKSFILAESFISIGNLIFAIHDYYKIKEIASKANDYKTRLTQINESFENHITKFNYDKVLENGGDLTLVFKKILEDVKTDLDNLKILIYDINMSIKDCKNKKISSGIGIGASVFFAASSAISAIATGGASIPITIMHAVNSGVNIVSGGIHISNLVESVKVAEELNKLLDEAIKRRDEIKNVIENLNNSLSELKSLGNCVPIYKYY